MMKVIISSIYIASQNAAMVEGWYVDESDENPIGQMRSTTRFHGTVEEPQLSKLIAVVNELREIAAERALERESVVRHQKFLETLEIHPPKWEK